MAGITEEARTDEWRQDLTPVGVARELTAPHLVIAGPNDDEGPIAHTLTKLGEVSAEGAAAVRGRASWPAHYLVKRAGAVGPRVAGARIADRPAPSRSRAVDRSGRRTEQPLQLGPALVPGHRQPCCQQPGERDHKSQGDAVAARPTGAHRHLAHI